MIFILELGLLNVFLCFRTRPVVQVKVSLVLPEQIDQEMATCREHDTPSVCFNVSVCFSVRSRHFKGAIGTLKIRVFMVLEQWKAVLGPFRLAYFKNRVERNETNA